MLKKITFSVPSPFRTPSLVASIFFNLMQSFFVKPKIGNPFSLRTSTINEEFLFFYINIYHQMAIFQL